MPYSLTLNRASHVLPVIAEALLAEGILRAESHWMGSLHHAVYNAFTQWLIEAGTFRHLGDLEMFYTDDVAAMHESVYEFEIHEWDDEKVAVCGFGINTCGWDQVILGPGIERLERLQRGAGYSVLGLLSFAAWSQLHVGGLDWAFERATANECGYDAPDREANPEEWREHCRYLQEEGVITATRFLETVPLQAVQARWKASLVKDAIAFACDQQQVREREILIQAMLLADAMKSGVRRRGIRANDVRYLAASIVQALVIRWSANDDVPALIDDYHDELSQTSEGAYVCNLHLFDPRVPASHPRSCRNALRSFKRSLGILAELDRLLGMLDWDRSLMGVFAQEEARVRV